MGNVSSTTQIESAVADFVRRWHASAAAERANFQSFCNELHEENGPGSFSTPNRGQPARPSEGEILRRLAALNAEQAEEERRGIVRWLRPKFQNPTGSAQTEGTLALTAAAPANQAKPLASKRGLGLSSGRAQLRYLCRKVVPMLD